MLVSATLVLTTILRIPCGAGANIFLLKHCTHEIKLRPAGPDPLKRANRGEPVCVAGMQKSENCRERNQNKLDWTSGWVLRASMTLEISSLTKTKGLQNNEIKLDGQTIPSRTEDKDGSCKTNPRKETLNGLPAG